MRPRPFGVTGRSPGMAPTSNPNPRQRMVIAPSIIDSRRHQMFPTLQPAEIARLRRFGQLQAFAKGEVLARVGEVGRGLSIILSGSVEISQRHQSAPSTPIVTHDAGALMGELAHHARGQAVVYSPSYDRVQGVVVPPERFRAIFLAEDEVRKRIMRALSLRRVGLLGTGAGGPVIIGHSGDGDMVRL